MASKQNVYGEGNYEASRKYYDDAKKFVDSGRVDQAARDAAPKNAGEAAEMEHAEEAALLRAKGTKKPAPIKEPESGRPPVDDPSRPPHESEAKEAATPSRPGRGPDRR